MNYIPGIIVDNIEATSLYTENGSMAVKFHLEFVIVITIKI